MAVNGLEGFVVLANKSHTRLSGKYENCKLLLLLFRWRMMILGNQEDNDDDAVVDDVE